MKKKGIKAIHVQSKICLNSGYSRAGYVINFQSLQGKSPTCIYSISGIALALNNLEPTT